MKPRDLRRRSHLGNEDLGGVPQYPRRMRDRDGKVASRSRDDAAVWGWTSQHPIERPSRFERTGVLKKLELETDACWASEGAGTKVDDRGPPRVTLDPREGGFDVCTGDRRGHQKPRPTCSRTGVDSRLRACGGRRPD